MRVVCICVAIAMLSGCVTTETVHFRPKPDQQAMVRDGTSALVSRRKNSIVLIRPAAREFRTGGRPVFVVGMNNLSKGPLDFRVGDIQATQSINGEVTGLKVITYEELAQEERNRQVASAILVGLAAGANAAAASQAGYYHSTSTVVGPHGGFATVNTTGYSPTAAAIAQSNASAQNEAMISATIERGQANLANLEQSVMKDNTLLPGEWYGGQLHLQPLAQSGEAKSYKIVLMVGADRHEIEIEQASSQ
jgi:hypothetical protein